MEFHAAEAYSNPGLTNVQYNIRRLCSEEKNRSLFQLTPTTSLRKYVIHTVVEIQFGVKYLMQSGFKQFVIKTEQVHPITCHDGTGRGSGTVTLVHMPRPSGSVV